METTVESNSLSWDWKSPTSDRSTTYNDMAIPSFHWTLQPNADEIRERMRRTSSTAETHRKRSEAAKRRADHTFLNLHSPESRRKAAVTKRTIENRIRSSRAVSGEKSHFWRGGVTAANQSARRMGASSIEFRLWKEAVFARDNNTCQMKDDTCGGRLEADHIKSWLHFPELRFDVSNGRVLCQHHHRQTPNYGGRVDRDKPTT